MSSHLEHVIGPSKRRHDGNPNQLQKHLAQLGSNDRRMYKRRLIIAAKSDYDSVTGLFNSFPYHAAPLALNVATNVALRALDPSANNKIQVTSHPWIRSASKARSLAEGRGYRSGTSPFPRWKCLQKTGPDSDKEYGKFRLTAYLSAVLILLAFILVNCTFVVNPIEEKMCNVKQLQLMTGLQPAYYWMANFTWDYFVYFLVVLAAMLLIFIIEQAKLVNLSINGGLGVLFLILMSYGFSCIFLAYLLSRRSKTVAGGFAVVVLVHLLTGIILGFPVLSMDEQSWHAGGIYRFLIMTLKVICYFVPSLPALTALARYIHTAGSNQACYLTDLQLPPAYRNTEYLSYVEWSRGKLDPNGGGHTYSESGVGQEVLIIVILGVIYAALLMLFEYGLWKKVCRGGTPPPFPPNIFDDDVYQEAERVNFMVQNGKERKNVFEILF